MISGVVVTRNSQDQLFDCLESLKDFVDEIVVVDLESGDMTVEIANKFKARVIAHPPVDFVEKVRQLAINEAKYDWIVLLDPDERLTPKLKLALTHLDPKICAVNIARKNIFFGKWVRHTNFWPDRQIRFFQKSDVSWPSVIHAYPIVSGQTLDLADDPDLAIVHHGYASWHEFFDRQNRYSSAAGGKFNYFNLFWQPTREFLVRYIKHQGFKDGFLGLALTYSLAIYQLMVQVKLWEKARN